MPFAPKVQDDFTFPDMIPSNDVAVKTPVTTAPEVFA